jgi:hypothetical protein
VEDELDTVQFKLPVVDPANEPREDPPLVLQHKKRRQPHSQARPMGEDPVDRRPAEQTGQLSRGSSMQDEVSHTDTRKLSLGTLLIIFIFAGTIGGLAVFWTIYKRPVPGQVDSGSGVSGSPMAAATGPSQPAPGAPLQRPPSAVRPPPIQPITSGSEPPDAGLADGGRPIAGPGPQPDGRAEMDAGIDDGDAFGVETAADDKALSGGDSRKVLASRKPAVSTRRKKRTRRNPRRRRRTASAKKRYLLIENTKKETVPKQSNDGCQVGGLGKIDVGVAGGWAYVHIDGKKVRSTPLMNYQMPSGKHKVVLRDSQGRVIRIWRFCLKSDEHMQLIHK